MLKGETDVEASVLVLVLERVVVKSSAGDVYTQYVYTRAAAEEESPSQEDPGLQRLILNELPRLTSLFSIT